MRIPHDTAEIAFAARCVLELKGLPLTEGNVAAVTETLSAEYDAPESEVIAVACEAVDAMLPTLETAA